MAIHSSIALSFGGKNEDDFDLTLQRCDTDHETACPLHWHDCFEIIYVRTGVFHVVLGDKEFVLTEEDIAVIPPRTIHATNSSMGERFDSIVYGYTESLLYTPDLSISNLQYLAPFRKLRPYADYILRGDSAAVVQLRDLLRQGAEIYESHDAMRVLNMRINILSVHALLYSIYAFTSQDAHLSSYLIDTQNYIEKHLPDDISPYTIAREIHISYSHLARVVQAEMGMTISELITSMRINSAEQIFMEHPTISVTECALAVGFSDVSYFIKQFRKHKGMNPRSFLKMIQKI